MSKSNQSINSNPSNPIKSAHTQPFFISAYAPKNRCLLHTPSGEGRTKQSHKSECDINVIMARYMQTGVIDFVTKHQPHYGDVTALDYTTAMNQIAQAQSMFHELPSSVRNRFENNPAAFLDFVQDPRNAAEAHEMGLMRPDYQPPKPNATTASLDVPESIKKDAKQDPKTDK